MSEVDRAARDFPVGITHRLQAAATVQLAGGRAGRGFALGFCAPSSRFGESPESRLRQPLSGRGALGGRPKLPLRFDALQPGFRAHVGVRAMIHNPEVEGSMNAVKTARLDLGRLATAMLRTPCRR